MNSSIKKAAALAAALALLAVSGCGNATEFSGSRAKNDDSFTMEYQVLNMTDKSEMALEAGDAVDVNIVSEAGSVSVLVTGSDGAEIYRGDNADTGSFRLEITKADTYTFSVTGAMARGSVTFTKVSAD